MADGQDVTQQISKLGHKTYDALPPAIKDVFAEPKGKGPEGSPVKPRRGSAAGKVSPLTDCPVQSVTSLDV